jgi:cytochrome c oxidase subunit 2
VLGGLVFTGCKLPTFGAFDAPTKQGQDALKLWQGFFIAGLVVFVFMFILIAFAVLRYRRRSDAIPRQTQYHTALEIIYTVVPIVTVLVLFGFTFVTENEVDAFAANTLNINVTAFQWGWEFQYPTYDVKVIGVETQNPVMVMPVGQPVRIYLRSNDVIHGFYIPAFNFSRYAQPGVVNSFDFDVQHTGLYRGQCTQFCGLYHSLMIFQVKAVTGSQFQAWVSQMQGTATAGTGSGTAAHGTLTSAGHRA